MAQGGGQCPPDPLPFNLWPAPVGGGTWGKPPSWVTKPSPPLPQDGAGHPVLPFLQQGQLIPLGECPAGSQEQNHSRSAVQPGAVTQLSPQLQGLDGATLSLRGAGGR